MGRHSLSAQLHSNFGSTAWDRDLPARRNAELRKLMVGFAAAGALLRYPPPRRRNTDAHAGCATVHAEPRPGTTSTQKKCIAGRYLDAMPIPARPISTRAAAKSWSTGISTAPATHGREVAPRAPTLIRKDQTQREKCCVSSSAIRFTPARRGSVPCPLSRLILDM